MSRSTTAVDRAVPDTELIPFPLVSIFHMTYNQPEGLREALEASFAQDYPNLRTLFLIDGVRLNNSVFREGPNQYAGTVDPLSLRGIEVVKGPQSARYGRNAFMGAINYIAKKPSEELEIQANVTIGDEERLDGGFAISGPLGERVRFRVSADHTEFDGS